MCFTDTDSNNKNSTEYQPGYYLYHQFNLSHGLMYSSSGLKNSLPAPDNEKRVIKRSLHIVNEHFQSVINALSAMRSNFEIAADCMQALCFRNHSRCISKTALSLFPLPAGLSFSVMLNRISQ